jgi:formate/nitrite transporter
VVSRDAVRSVAIKTVRPQEKLNVERESNDVVVTVDALLPREMAAKAERIGGEKVRLDIQSLLTLAVLAGAFIAFGAMLATIAAAGADGVLPYGFTRLLSGLVFSLGLILVVIGGAELFTGNNLMVMAWASGKVTFRDLIRAWTLVYIGNFAGSAATAVFVFLTGLYEQGGGTVGAVALVVAEDKAVLPFTEALVRGVLGNVLVCLAVWMCYSARTTADRILVIIPPISAFVAAGFEHSVANMYLLPFGLLIKDWAPNSFWLSIDESPAAFDSLTWIALVENLLPVTIGNVIGGGVLVGAVYWFVYLRRE